MAPNKVDFPQPLGPTMPHRSDGSTRKFIFWRSSFPEPVERERWERRRVAPLVSPRDTPMFAGAEAGVAEGDEEEDVVVEEWRVVVVVVEAEAAVGGKGCRFRFDDFRSGVAV